MFQFHLISILILCFNPIPFQLQNMRAQTTRNEWLFCCVRNEKHPQNRADKVAETNALNLSYISFQFTLQIKARRLCVVHGSLFDLILFPIWVLCVYSVESQCFWGMKSWRWCAVREKLLHRFVYGNYIKVLVQWI